MGHSFQNCNAKRSLIFGAPYLVEVSPPETEIQVFGTQKCTYGNETGRWVYNPNSPRCQPPICFGQKGYK